MKQTDTDRGRKREIERKQRGDFEPDRNKCRDFSGESGAGVGSELFRRENWIFRKPKRWQFSPPFFTQMARTKKTKRTGSPRIEIGPRTDPSKLLRLQKKNLQACKLFFCSAMDLSRTTLIVVDVLMEVNGRLASSSR